jgi:hypothetical protein
MSKIKKIKQLRHAGNPDHDFIASLVRGQNRGQSLCCMVGHLETTHSE